ncbi:MAG: AAA family ATPase [Bryobacteraceae bacterium]
MSMEIAVGSTLERKPPPPASAPGYLNGSAVASGVAPKIWFVPKVPHSQELSGIAGTVIEDLFLRHVFLKRCNSIGSVAASTSLSYPIIERVFRDLRQQRLIEVTGMIGDDYVFTLTGAGRTTASERCQTCKYAGPAPVSLSQYQRAIRDQRPRVVIDRAALRAAFSDLVVTDRMLDQLGPALVAQSSLFLYGPSGTGKTSLAERLLRVYGDLLVLPYAVEADNQTIVLYDPAVHSKVPMEIEDMDPRWFVCKRPCVVVGGELVPSMLELRFDSTSGTYAPPVQMKANGGILVIDDFGRQLISPRDLLNRWIVPLDRRLDYLSLNYGVRFDIPFEMMIVFATNLDPGELADEAFLRRIPNKILVDAISDEEFDEIYRRVLERQSIPCDEGTGEYLRELCVSRGGDLRASYPRDMCQIIVALKQYEGEDLRITRPDLDRAVELFFGPLAKVHDS